MTEEEWTAHRVLGASPAAARQLASRARRRVAGSTEAPRAGREERERVLAAFRAAYEAGDVDGLVALLHPDVVYRTDGGGRVSAARKVIAGAERVAMVLMRVARRHTRPTSVLQVGGETALALLRDGELFAIDTFDIGADGRVRAIHRVLNPDKLPAKSSPETVTTPGAISSP